MQNEFDAIALGNEATMLKKGDRVQAPYLGRYALGNLLRVIVSAANIQD